MFITVMTKRHIQHMFLSNLIDGYYELHVVLQKDEYFLATITGIDNQWILRFERDIEINQKIDTVALMSEQFLAFTIHGESLYIYVEEDNKQRDMYDKYEYQESILIGRHPQCHICIDNTFISNQHAQIKYEANNITIQDLGSKNKVYINRWCHSFKELTIGDVIYLMGYKIIIGPTYLAINKSKDISVSLHKYKESKKKTTPLPSIPIIPYITYIPTIVLQDIVIEAPTAYISKEKTSMFASLGPSLTMGVASMISSLFMIQNTFDRGGTWKEAIPSLIMSISMLLGVLMWPLIQRRRELKNEIKQEEKRYEDYQNYLNMQEEKLATILLEQSTQLQKRFVSYEMLKSYIQQGNIGFIRLHKDHTLSVRLGSYDCAPCWHLQYQELKESEDRCAKLYIQFQNIKRWIKHAPFILNLEESFVNEILIQNDRQAHMIYSLILQIATMYCIDQVRIVLITENEKLANLRFLQHLTIHQGLRLYVKTHKDAMMISQYIMKELHEKDKRKIAYYVIISCSVELEKNMECITNIVNGSYLGFSYIAVSNHEDRHPYHFQTSIDFYEKDAKAYSCDYDKKEFKAELMETSSISEAVSILSNITFLTIDEKVMREQISMLELHASPSLEEMNILQRWNQHKTSHTLNVSIGLDKHDHIIELDIHEKQHGPHGIIAGMTGSGKSEFIISYVLSLAIQYHPEDVSFFLIDYKGGGMALALSKLPHVKGIMSNLDGAILQRTLLALKYELKKRQALFLDVAKAFHIANIDIYKYQELYHKGMINQAISHLIIVCDEFAELKKQHFEFMDFLISSARIGRSLGIHLLLATQKPTGVIDDQIWSNSRFHICLKVSDRSDSMDVLKKDDAATLKNPGRFYLQVGYDEMYVLGQSAYSGVSYEPNKQHYSNGTLHILGNTGNTIESIDVNKTNKSKHEVVSETEYITNYLSLCANKLSFQKTSLCLAPLQESLCYDDKPNHIADAIDEKILIGLYDKVDECCYQGLYFSIAHHCILYGNEGNAMFLYALLTMCMKVYTTKELHIYILNFDETSLDIFKQASIMKGIFCIEEEDIIASLFIMLKKEIKRRKDKREHPNILIIINHYARLNELQEDWDDTMMYLICEGEKYGISFFLIAYNTNEISYKVTMRCKHTFMLQQYDVDEYRSVFHETLPVYKDITLGRGFIKEEHCYEFQIFNFFEDVIQHLIEDSLITKN